MTQQPAVTYTMSSQHPSPPAASPGMKVLPKSVSLLTTLGLLNISIPVGQSFISNKNKKDRSRNLF
jgi:hypothetical protein